MGRLGSLKFLPNIPDPLNPYPLRMQDRKAGCTSRDFDVSSRLLPPNEDREKHFSDTFLPFRRLLDETSQAFNSSVCIEKWTSQRLSDELYSCRTGKANKTVVLVMIA